MRQVLKELNETPGIVGSLVITPDGIMVAAAVDDDVEEDTVAAVAASLLVSMKRGLAGLRTRSDLESYTLAGTDGKIVFYDMDNSYLVVVAEAETSLEANAGAIEHAIHGIRNRRVA